MEKERDYYFSKLREVELLCQEHGEENAPFVDRLMEVLYASDEQVSLWLPLGIDQDSFYLDLDTFFAAVHTNKYK